jgi:hypothetical protein
MFAALACLLMGAPATAAAPALPKGEAVRIQSGAIDGRWHEGKIGLSPAGCTMIYLTKKTSGGYESLTLLLVEKLQQMNHGAWIDVPVAPLLATEPKACREEFAD